MNEIDFNRLCDAYRQAVREKDVEAFLSLYHPEARVFDTWGVWAYEGVPERRKVIELWFSSLGDERVEVSFDRRLEAKGNGMAMLTARVVFVGLSADGRELRSMQNRLTWVLQPAGDTWKIRHEHTSVPIAFDDLKGILQRDERE